ncbi:MAG: HD domain-containing protein [Halobacteriales archaeon]|nr:HD domain-containing protein [Halobacteriales archaeon]
MTKTIKDPVHDHIRVDGFALDLLDTPEMQRLRHVRQLGTAYLVYPSANHTRFEHSLGVYHLAVRALDNIGVTGVERDEVRAAALLHDVGHTPFSHNVEGIVEEHIGKKHDEVDGIIEGDVARVLEENRVSPDRVASLVRGEGRYGQLVSGALDVDRMDYLVRDAHHTGVPYGTIDSGRLVLELGFVDDELVLGEGNVQTAEALLLARSLMHPTVYSHHVARISTAMLERATQHLIETDDDIDAETVRRMDDHELTVALRENDETREIAERLAERRLYKRAVWKPRGELRDTTLDADPRELEAEIAESAGVEPHEVVIDVSTPPGMAETEARVVVDGEKRMLEDVSSLVKTLRRVHEEQWRFGVYAPEEKTDVVEKASEGYV